MSVPFHLLLEEIRRRVPFQIEGVCLFTLQPKKNVGETIQKKVPFHYLACLFFLSISVVYTVEFQKRGLPHCYILLFIQQSEKPRSSHDIKQHIFAGIPDEQMQPKLYKLVQKFMVYGPCGVLNVSSPCMVNEKCSKFYPMAFREKTLIDNAVDEIQNYYDCRYISACEASWRLFGFEIQFKEPNVIRLPFHLLNEQNVLYEDHQPLENVIESVTGKDSMFMGWMKANKEFEVAYNLTFAELLSVFVWDKQAHLWRPRKQGHVIGHFTHIPQAHGEEYFLRLLLNYQKGCQTFDDIHSIDGIVYDTYKKACYALGRLFAMLLMSNNIVCPDIVWQHCWKHCADDVLCDRRQISEIKSITLARIESLLQKNGRSLKEFIDMPFSECLNSIDPHDTVRDAYDTILNAISRDMGGLFFVYGYGGTRKTFLWNSLSASISAKGQIVLNIASSGIAALLLPNGRTAHSRFKVPLSVNQDSICNIKQGMPLARLISFEKLII
ncbi:hypothetical protein AHAS_Ahas17G0242000 [Arachis hypogaea]